VTPGDGELWETPFFWTDGDRAWLRTGGADADADADEGLVPSPRTQLVDVNLDPPFPNAPRFRAHTGAGGLIAAADRQTHAALLAMITDQPARRYH
jgi:hypothetical protein